MKRHSYTPPTSLREFGFAAAMVTIYLGVPMIIWGTLIYLVKDAL